VILGNLPYKRSVSVLIGYLASPQVGLSAAALFWSGNFIVGRALRDAISPLSLNFWRWMIALAILLPFTYGSLWVHRQVILREWKLIAAIGLTGIAAFHTCVYLALVTTSAVNALLLLAMAPLLIVLGSCLVFQDRITLQQLLGISVSLVGAIVLIAQGSMSLLMALRFSTGDLWMLLAVVLWTIYSLLLKRRPVELPQTALLSASTVAAILLMSPLYLWGLSSEQQSLPSTQVVWGLLYVSLFASVLAFLFWNNGVSRIGPSRAGAFIYMMPVFGAVLSVAFLGEGVQSFQLAGGALVFSGIAVMNWKRSGQ
jgi:drug/metabolite transporter (DMT)-like permease